MKTQYIEIEKCDYIQVGVLLKKGEIIAFPTDTVYGLGAVFSDVSAVKKIFEAKGRDEGKPLSI
ncbi:MAG: Sua5/YciO/YrdC/YwlC family protein, partial [Parasporobacterium sp.]|nr:Sua5/YciO/YrdC/YwlC family protein [Parasporobacterium sp.]